MNFKKIFSRKVICSKELKKVIKDWCKNGGWKFNDFSYLLLMVGIQVPVKLSEYNGDTFKCSTSDNKEVQISLMHSSNSFDDPNRIFVTDQMENAIYYIVYKNRAFQKKKKFFLVKIG